MSKVIINLDNINDISEYSENTMLQQAAKKKLDTLLNGFIENVEKNIDSGAKYYCKERNKQINKLQRHNNTIFVSGQRGTGKTTFLNAVLDFYSKYENGICPLAFIDPTLIETHQNIIVDIVVKFKQLYDESLKYCSDQEQYHELNKYLEKMAEGLRLLGEQKNNHSKHDDAWFLSQALKNSKSGQCLEERFHQFIDKIATTLNKKLFIIAIDDVDTNTEKAYEILENIRRYLSHPRIVVIISGDVTLYNYIIKNKKTIELADVNKSKEKDTETERLVGHLTQQYLTKIFPTYQRIELKNLKKINNQIEVNIESSREQKKRITTLLDDILTKTLNLKPQHINTNINFLLSQPIRSIVQLLKQITDDKTNDGISYLPEHLTSALKYIFINELIYQNVDNTLLEDNEPEINQIANTVFDLCYRYGELETGFYLRPDNSDDAYNAAKFYMAALLSKKFENNTLSNALKFMLACAASANTYIHYVENSNESDKDNLNERYKNYIGITRNENIITIAAHLNAVIYDENKGNKKIQSGVIRINRRKLNEKYFDEKNFQEITKWKHTDVIGSLEQLSSKINKKTDGSYEYKYIDYVAATTILISSHSIQVGAEKRDYISALSLFSVIAQLLEEDGDVDIRRFIRLNTYSSPDFLKKSISYDESLYNNESNEIDEDVTSENENIKSLNENINNWIENTNEKSISCSPLLIGKIWERIQYSLISISEKSTEKVSYGNKSGDVLLETAFSRFIWGVINAIVIEEVRYSKNVPQDIVDIFISAKNVSTTYDELIANLTKLGNFIESNKEIKFSSILPISHAFLGCPLLLPFIIPMILSEKTDSNKSKTSSPFKNLYLNESNDKLSNEENEMVKFIKSSIQEKEGYLFISKLIISGCFRNSTKSAHSTGKASESE
ncbi:CpaF/VirB11 family protein [Pectobacterium colocasium]|uniref:CpaF/VirB11 family protein n=1 Tax=Pectobacterium colocasium TaxID=2878098 RepID=UPI001CD58731|nr:CpaF/VirB11 family protein [Pectobacterium colocasium]